MGVLRVACYVLRVTCCVLRETEGGVFHASSS